MYDKKQAQSNLDPGDLLTPSFLSSASSIVVAPQSPYDHFTFLTTQILLRLSSRASDYEIVKADEFLNQWQIVNSGDAGGGTDSGKKRKSVDPQSPIQVDHVYHLEYSLPGDGSKDKSSGPEACKYFIDVLDLQFMAKVYSGRSENAKSAQNDDTSVHLFRYFRRNGHTFLLLEVDTEVMLTETLILRLASHRLDIDIFETADKLCAKAKADLKAPRKMNLPRFSTAALSLKHEDEVINELDYKPSEHELFRLSRGAKALFEEFQEKYPGWARLSLSTAFPPPVLPVPVRSLEASLRTDPPPVLPGKLAKNANATKAKLEQEKKALQARRKVESARSPVIQFHTSASKFFLRGNNVVMRGVRNPTAKDDLDDKAELVTSIYDAFLYLGFRDGDFMSTGQRARLNPISITVQTAENMPGSSVSLDRLREVCYPVHIEFDRLGLERYRTPSLMHDEKLLWDDTVVVFAGSLDPELLKEFLAGPPFEIQLHDRDRKDGICENPYGVAKLDLYPLFLHNLMEREFEVHVNPSTSHSDRWITPAAQPVQLLKPVIPSAVFEKKPAKRTDEKSQASGLKSTKDKTKPNIAPPLPRVDPLPAGSYQDAGTTLKILISSAVPFRDFIQASPRSNSTPFCRCLFVLDDSLVSQQLIAKTRLFISCCNAKVLGQTYPPRTVFAVANAIATIKLITEIDCKTSTKVFTEDTFDKLDIITGFHLFDSVVHVVLVEGLYDRAMATFAQFLVDQLPHRDSDKCKISWDSSLRYSSRLYGALGAMIFDVQIKETLQSIISNSYIDTTKRYPVTVAYTANQMYQMAFVIDVPRDLSKYQLFPSPENLRQLQTSLGQLRSIQKEGYDVEALQCKLSSDFLPSNQKNKHNTMGQPS